MPLKVKLRWELRRELTREEVLPQEMARVDWYTLVERRRIIRVDPLHEDLDRGRGRGH